MGCASCGVVHAGMFRTTCRCHFGTSCPVRPAGWPFQSTQGAFALHSHPVPFHNVFTGRCGRSSRRSAIAAASQARLSGLTGDCTASLAPLMYSLPGRPPVLSSSVVKTGSVARTHCSQLMLTSARARAHPECVRSLEGRELAGPPMLNGEASMHGLRTLWCCACRLVPNNLPSPFGAS